jgi:lysyl-tRNA synthetase class 2
MDGIRQYAQVDPDRISDEDLAREIKKYPDIAPKVFAADGKVKVSRGEMLVRLFEATVEEHLWQPTFVLDHPVEISPLTKAHRTQTGLVERFEPFAACMEIGNAYSELNDPEEQFERLKEQESRRLIDEEAQPMDADFIHAIDTGMPPTGGVGLGVERIVMILTDRPSIRDIILFPTMKFR